MMVMPSTTPAPTVAKVATCGDGIVQALKNCDDGNDVETDTCNSVCKFTRCGDGIVQRSSTVRDDGNDSDFDNCRVNCTLNICGDGFVNLQDGAEECDDQNSDQSDDRSANCVLPTCGDGIVKLTTEPELYNGALPLPSLEDCDDNANPNDGCDACTEQVWNPEPLFVTEVDLASGQFSRISDIDFDLADQMYVIDSNHEQIFKITGTTAQESIRRDQPGRRFHRGRSIRLLSLPRRRRDHLVQHRGRRPICKIRKTGITLESLGRRAYNVYSMETTDSYYENYSNYFTSETSVRQIDANGIITTVIHFANQGSYSPSQTVLKLFYTIRDIDVDGSGVVYVLVELDVQVTYGCEDWH